MLGVSVMHLPLLGSFLLGDPLPLDKFAGQFSASVRLRESTEDFVLARNIDRVRSTITRISDVELTSP